MNATPWIQHLTDPLVLLGFLALLAAWQIGPIVRDKLESVPQPDSFKLWALLIRHTTAIILVFGVLLILAGVLNRWRVSQNKDVAIQQRLRATVDEQMSNERSLSECNDIVMHLLKTILKTSEPRSTNSPLLGLFLPTSTISQHPTILGVRSAVQAELDIARRAGLLTNRNELRKLAAAQAAIKTVLVHTDESERSISHQLVTEWGVTSTAYNFAKPALADEGIPDLSHIIEAQVRLRNSFRTFDEYYQQWRRALLAVLDSNALDVSKLAEFHWQHGRFLYYASAVTEDKRTLSMKHKEVLSHLKNSLVAQVAEGRIKNPENKERSQ